MKILIAYDGSDCADAAIDDLRRAGLPPRAEALVHTVAEFWMPPLQPATYDIIVTSFETNEKDARSLAEQACKRLHTIFPKWDVRAEASTGSPAWELIAAADRWQPDLIAVGSHGRSALGRLVLGSVSQKILTEAHCSVRVARSRYELGSPPARLLVGLDVSDDAQRAVEEIAARPWQTESEVRLLTSVEPPLAIEGEYPMHIGLLRDVQKAAEEKLSAAGLRVSSVMREGNPKHTLLKEAEAWEASTIFVGAKGHKFLERFLLGSVSAAIAARAHCSVEVVRPPKEGK